MEIATEELPESGQATETVSPRDGVSPPIHVALRKARVANRQWHLRAGVLFAITAVMLAALYTTLSNRSSWFTRSSVAGALSAPRSDFRVGMVEWNVAAYATDPALLPFREAFRRRCNGRRGIEAAVCVSNAMARQFPHGRPPVEFIDRVFDPTLHLARHAGGAPGHCMNRSAILATQLLSVGLPARVTQLRPRGEAGHTAVEVWDESYGWVLVDPTYGAVLGDGSSPASAVRLLQAPEAARWYALARAPAPSSLVQSARQHGPEGRLYRGRVLYPEPWLYLRVGRKHAPWPFRGTFACVGSEPLECGEGHRLLLLVIVGSGLAAVVLVGAAMRERREKRS